MRMLLHAARRLYAALLLLLPADVRRAHGAEMRETSRHLVEDALRQRGVGAAARAVVRECVDVVAAAVRASRRAPQEIAQDVAYAWRLTWRRPAFTATVVGTLALGIGATATVFSVVNALLLRPLPFEASERLVLLTVVGKRAEQTSVSPLDFHDLSRMVASFAATTALTPQQVTITGGAEPERVDAAAVTWSFFAVLGARLPVGRGFTRDEGEAGRERVAVLGHGLWRRRFGGSPSVIGQSLVVDGDAHTIVGVAPPELTLPGRAQLWRPLVFTPHQVDPSQRGARWVFVVARLQPGASREQAAAEVRAAGARLAADYPRTHRDRGASIRPLHEHLVRDTRPGLLALFGAVALVFLIACANVASLLLARSSGRAGEMTVRVALGASRGRLLRQHVVENLLLTGAAAGAGLAAARWGTAAAVAWLPETLPRAEEIAVDMRVVAFAVVLAGLVGVALGAAGAFGFRAHLSAGSPRATAGRARAVRRMLVVAEVAMALVLLTAAGLFVKSLSRLYAVAPGFDPSRVLTFTLTLPSNAYPEPDAIARFVERLRSELAALPEVESAGAIFGLPLTSGFSASGTFSIIGRAENPDDEPLAMLRVATPGYFDAMRIPVVRGRDFTDRDRFDQPGVAIVNEAAARRYWPGADPIGQTIRLHVGVAGVKQMPRQIVGVVRDVRYDGLDEAPRPETYIPHAQHPVDSLAVTLRAERDPHVLAGPARAVLQRLDPLLPMSEVATMEDLVAGSMAARRFSLLLLAAFAGIALLMAALGIYGVLAYTVGQRTREIGVRLAVGARRAQVIRLVIVEGLALVGIGMLLGLGITGAITGVVRGLLYDVRPSDPPTLLAVGVVVMLVALGASYLPARRAAAVDPVAALRAE